MLGDRIGLGDSHRHHIHITTDDICPGFVATWSTEHRLVFDDQAIFIDRHIEAGEDTHNAWQRLGSGHIDSDHAGMGALAELDAHPQLPFDVNIAGIARFAGYFAARVDAFDRFADDRACFS